MEFVYVVKRSDLFDLHFPQGFLSCHSVADEVETYLDRARSLGFFVERRHAEEDSDLKQIIPYTVVTRGTEVLLLRRSKKGGDARLHDKLSIGVGGHINPPDAEFDDLLLACTEREIDEEIEIEGKTALKTIGVINDDSNAVGSVHFGLVQILELEGGDVRSRETELLDASFIPVSELKELAQNPDSNLETWSTLIVAQIDNFLSS